MRHKGVSYAKYGYIFSLPFILAFLIFSLYPTIYTAVIGFTDLKGLGQTSFQILEDPFFNFKQVLNSDLFRTSLSNTAIIWISNFIPQMIIALLLTAWFTSRHYRIKGQGIFKVLFYMPNIITAATIAILFRSLFMYPTGVVNHLLQSLGLIKEPINFLIDKGYSRGMISFIQFWMWYGYSMLILISGVLGMNPELFEAAEIDGASDAKSFLYITLPNLRTILIYSLITSLIGGLQMFDIPRLFNNGMPDNSTLTTSLYIYNQAFSGSYLYNRAAAASMIMFILIAVLSGIIFFLMRDPETKKLNKDKRLAKKAERSSGR